VKIVLIGRGEFMKNEPFKCMRGALFLAFFFLTAGRASAQACPRDEVNQADLIAKIAEAGNQFAQFRIDDPNHSVPGPDRNVIYRLAAIGGNPVIPALRRISKPGMPENDIPGAAQASLARLGDEEALQQLEQDMNGASHGGWATGKLLRAADDKSIAILMRFLVAHLTDNSLYVNMGDYGSDVRYAIINGLAPALQNPPTEPSGVPTVTFEKWAAWWEQNKGKPLTLVISRDLQDPYLQCLARKFEWGFPEAILDLGAAGNAQAIPALRKLAQLGDQRSRASGINTVRGRAQAALVKLGDSEEFKAIADELESPGCFDAVIKMQYIGGRKAVEALIESLKGANFLSAYPDYKNDGRNAPRMKLGHDQAITNTLAKMVVSPPEITGKLASKKMWLAWWARNSESAQIIQQPYVTQE
jgi:HEAT repeat protein